MKTKAIIKIVVWSLVLALVSSLLGLLLTNRTTTGRNLGSYFKPGTENYNVGNINTADLTGEDVVDVMNIKSISIDWIDGNVTISATNEPYITITETFDGEIDEDQKLRWNISNYNLDVIYKRSSRNIFDKFVHSKSLHISVPKSVLNSLNKFQFHGVSAKLFADDVIAKDVNVNTVSGDITFTNSTANFFNSNSVSGKVVFGVVNGSANCDTVSGDVELSVIDATKINFDGISADFLIYLPTDKTFNIDFDSVSGNAKNVDLDLIKNQVTVGAQLTIDAETVSGDLSIKKLTT